MDGLLAYRCRCVYNEILLLTHMYFYHEKRLKQLLWCVLLLRDKHKFSTKDVRIRIQLFFSIRNALILSKLIIPLSLHKLNSCDSHLGSFGLLNLVRSTFGNACRFSSSNLYSSLDTHLVSSIVGCEKLVIDLILICVIHRLSKLFSRYISTIFKLSIHFFLFSL